MSLHGWASTAPLAAARGDGRCAADAVPAELRSDMSASQRWDAIRATCAASGWLRDHSEVRCSGPEDAGRPCLYGPCCLPAPLSPLHSCRPDKSTIVLAVGSACAPGPALSMSRPPVTWCAALTPARWTERAWPSMCGGGFCGGRASLHRLQSGMRLRVQVELGRVLGKGAFGETHLASWQGQEVAVKCVRLKGHDEAASFLREADALAALQHPNIMGFFGARSAQRACVQTCSFTQALPAGSHPPAAACPACIARCWWPGASCPVGLTA